MISCIKCEHYQEKDLTGMSLLQKFQSVSGFCMDSNNPDFNEYARNFGRGIGRTDSYISPKWCAKRKNPKVTEEYYTEEEISEFVEDEKRYRNLVNMNKYVIGFDMAKEIDNTCLSFQFVNSCLEEMQDLWEIGDEYPLPEYNYKRLGLDKNSKLIISSIYENDNKDVFMSVLIR